MGPAMEPNPANTNAAERLIGLPHDKEYEEALEAPPTRELVANAESEPLPPWNDPPGDGAALNSGNEESEPVTRGDESTDNTGP